MNREPSTVLYLHGFASSPASGKITALRPLLESRGIELDTPDLNVPTFEEMEWEAVVGRAEEHARRTPPQAIVGSSMGALTALTLVQRGWHLPLVLIAPAFAVARRWSERIPPGTDPLRVFNHARNAEALIHRRFFEQMLEVEPERTAPPVRTTVIMGRRDESVPFADVESVWKRWEADGLAPESKFIEIADGDHGLVAYAPVIADAIVETTVEAAHDRHHT